YASARPTQSDGAWHLLGRICPPTDRRGFGRTDIKSRYFSRVRSGRSRAPTDIARHKDKMIAAAVWKNYRRKVRRSQGRTTRDRNLDAGTGGPAVAVIVVVERCERSGDSGKGVGLEPRIGISAGRVDQPTAPGKAKATAHRPEPRHLLRIGGGQRNDAQPCRAW